MVHHEILSTKWETGLEKTVHLLFVILIIFREAWGTTEREGWFKHITTLLSVRLVCIWEAWGNIIWFLFVWDKIWFWGCRVTKRETRRKTWLISRLASKYRIFSTAKWKTVRKFLSTCHGYGSTSIWLCTWTDAWGTFTTRVPMLKMSHKNILFLRTDINYGFVIEYRIESQSHTVNLEKSWPKMFLLFSHLIDEKVASFLTYIKSW